MFAKASSLFYHVTKKLNIKKVKFKKGTIQSLLEDDSMPEEPDVNPPAVDSEAILDEAEPVEGFDGPQDLRVDFDLENLADVAKYDTRMAEDHHVQVSMEQLSSCLILYIPYVRTECLIIV